MSAENQEFAPQLACEYEKESAMQTGSAAPLQNKYRKVDHSTPDGVHPTPQACEITMPDFDQRIEFSSEIRPEKLLACKSEAPSVLAKKHPKTGCPFIVILTADQARSIYLLRTASTAEGPSAQLVAGKSSLVAELFGVSPKTIRDVWNRKTWTQVTRSLWSEEEACLHEREHMTPEQRAAAGDTEPFLLKRRGRPPGSKDARPRKRRHPIAQDGGAGAVGLAGGGA